MEGPRIKVKATLFLLFLLVTMIPFLRASADDSPTTKWNKTYGGSRSEMAYCAQQTIDGGYFIAGYTSSFGAGAADFWLVKTDSNGNLQWNKTYGRANQDEAYAAQQTTDAGYILVGSTSSIETSLLDFWLVRTDSNGQELWNRTYGGSQEDVAYSVDQTADGGYIVAGSTNSFGSGNADFWLVKTDSNGNLQWNKTYGDFYDDVGYSVQQTTDGGYAVCGYTGSLGAGYEDFWLVKTDSDGNPEWNKTYGGIDSEYAYFLQQTSENGYIIAGSTYSLTTEFDMWIVKADSSGNMQWNRTYGGSLDEEAYGVRQTNDGGYVIAGFTDSFGNNREVYLIKTDSSGSIEWTQTYGGAQKDEACAVQQTSDGGYIVSGTTYSFGPSWDPNFWLIRLAGTHDVSIQDVVPSKTVVGRGHPVFINATVKNWGTSEETCDVTVYANATSIGTQSLTIAAGYSKTITLPWDTLSFPKGLYVISAYAQPASGETDTADNNCTGGWITVTVPGDVTGDIWVDMQDISIMIDWFMTSPPTWNPNCDVNNDNSIDMADISLAIDHFMQS
jgi:predicted secreted protein